MILKVAWRNIWRNKVRSIVVITAIAVGLCAGVFASAFVIGMMEQKMDSVVKLEMSHFQVHHPKFRDEMLPKYTIPRGQEIVNDLKKEAPWKGVSKRVISMLMLGSANNSGAIKVTGISPQDEAGVTDIHQHVVEGKYLEGIKRNPILISRKMAEQYKVKLRSKVVLTLQDVNGDMTAGAFRVAGIYDTKNAMYDKVNAFVRIEDLQKLLGVGQRIHEVAVLLKDHDLADTLAKQYQQSWPDLEVKSWMDLATGMRFMVEAQNTYTVVIVSIILVALLFSIINTMLMAVLERVREIGVLMAVGMAKYKVFLMIMYETIFLAMIGGPLGLVISWSLISYYGTHGWDLGDVGYSDLGFSNVVYPYLEASSYFTVTIMVIVMSILAAVYPAYKALKLIPVEAIRKI